MRLTTRATLTIVGLMLAAARGVGAQELRGVVRDSASRLPIPGAVVTLLDSTAAGVARTVTNERGQFRVVLLGNAVRRLRVVRLGFRPATAGLPAPVDGAIRVELEMTSISMSLTPVQVVAGPSCPRRRDSESALGVLEQARAGLLATVVARSDKPARMMRVRAVRTMDGYTDRVVHQRVRIDSAGTVFGSFGAARNAAEFVRNGFTADSAGLTRYYGPDAEVLLDDGFAAGYCFHLMPSARARANQIGLGFVPARQRGGRIDVEGALWIDTVARALVDIEYRYLGLDARAEAFQPGGHIWFREMPNGVVVIERWQIRIVGGNGGDEMVRPLIRTVDDLGRPMARSKSVYGVEVWGELARAVWPDGTSWAGSLGTIHLRAVDEEGRPLPGTIVKLADTDYEAVADSSGNVELPDLLPGPYAVAVVDPALETLGMAVPTTVEFTASRRWAILARLPVQSTQGYVGDLCRTGGSDGGGVRSLLTEGSGALVGRVTTPDGRPVGGARWSLRYRDFLGEHRVVKDALVSGDGTFQYCGLRRGERVMVDVSASGMEPVTVAAALDGHPTIVTAVIKPR